MMGQAHISFVVTRNLAGLDNREREYCEQRYKGYCSHIFAQATIDFLSKPGTQPFFAYLAFNCPHEPLYARRPS